MGDENPIRTFGDYSKPSHKGYMNTIELLAGNTCPITRRTIDQSADGKLLDRNAKESWALLEDLTLYDKESWNDPRDFAKPVKKITLSQEVPSTSDHRLIELENQVHHLMEAHLAPMQSTQENKITTSREICSGPHNTQYCMEDPEQAFIEYASLHTDEAEDDGEVMFIESIRKNDDSSEGEPEEEGSTTTEGVGAEYFDIFPTRRNFTYVIDFMIVENISSIIDPRLSKYLIINKEEIFTDARDGVRIYPDGVVSPAM
uniref:MAK10-like protein n=1 Tax=Tanacetum cinerariifolium TaxID=118510 RepID=A0A6L2P7P3_TANCI|nr:MAK10-like protein [Tanacetum cinerariifolium]